MIKINILAVGGVKENFFRDAISEYAKRLSRFCKLEIIEVNEESSVSSVNKKIELESQNLLKKLRGYNILLDREGKQSSSEELASLINSLQNQGESEITFIIGGSNGVSEELKDRVDKSISFGKITFPHQLFRVVLLEQIYRAFTINANLPYHK